MNLDCGWTTGYRDNTTGELQVDRAKFPDMAAYGAGLRARGMLFGMYAGGWHAQCCNKGKRGGNDTSWRHWDVDAATFARWCMDYLKSDPCCGHNANATAPLTPADVFNRYNAQWDAAFRGVSARYRGMVAGYTGADYCGHVLFLYHITIFHIDRQVRRPRVVVRSMCSLHCVITTCCAALVGAPTWEVHYSRLVAPKICLPKCTD